MSPLALLAPLAATLVALYMLRPRFRRRQLSSTRFLNDLPPRDSQPVRLTPTAPITSAPFYLQMAVLALVAAGLWSDQRRAGTADAVLGVWIWVDSSYSMTTLQAGERRIEHARKEALAAIRRSTDAADARVCFRVSAFDVERRDQYEGVAADAARAAVGAIEPRPAGTDLGLLRSLVSVARTAGVGDTDPARDTQCTITHALIITDRPAPPLTDLLLPIIVARRDDFGSSRSNAGFAGSARARTAPIVVWRDISQPVPNLGITAVVIPDDPFTPAVQAVTIDIDSWPVASAPVVTVTGPNGEQVVLGDSQRGASGSGRVSFTPTGPGEYRARIAQGGSYDGDDWVSLEVRPRARLRVDWQPTDRRLLDLLGWQLAVTAPQIRVADLLLPKIVARRDDFGRSRSNADFAGSARARRLDAGFDDVPTLLVGNGYDPTRNSRIALFDTNHPLLEGVDLDLAERAGMAGIATPQGFATCLRGDGVEDTYCAVRESPRAVYVPGLPTTRGDAVDVVSARLFFNALRWLSMRPDSGRTWTQLTPDGEPIVDGTDEAPDQHSARSRGSVSDLTPVPTGLADPTARWPPWLLAAAVVFALDRVLAVYGGARWR